METVQVSTTFVCCYIALYYIVNYIFRYRRFNKLKTANYSLLVNKGGGLQQLIIYLITLYYICRVVCKYMQNIYCDNETKSLFMIRLFHRTFTYRDIIILWLQQTVQLSCWSSMFNGSRPQPTHKLCNSAYLQN